MTIIGSDYLNFKAGIRKSEVSVFSSGDTKYKFLESTATYAATM